MTITVEDFLIRMPQLINISGNGSIAISHSYVKIAGSLNNTEVRGMTSSNVVAGSLVMVQAMNDIKIYRINKVKIKSNVYRMVANDTLTLMYDGTNFIEVSRSKQQHIISFGGNLTGNTTQYLEGFGYGTSSNPNFKNISPIIGTRNISHLKFAFNQTSFNGNLALFINGQLSTTWNPNTFTSVGTVVNGDLVGGFNLDIDVSGTDTIYIQSTNSDQGGTRIILTLS